MNMPPTLGETLKKRRHSCRHVGKIGMSRATDMEIIQVARQNNEIILTNDLDYGRLMAFEKSNRPSVVIFRVSRHQPDYLLKLFEEVLKREDESLEQGVIIVVEDHGIRIRKLPIE